MVVKCLKEIEMFCIVEDISEKLKYQGRMMGCVDQIKDLNVVLVKIPQLHIIMTVLE